MEGYSRCFDPIDRCDPSPGAEAKDEYVSRCDRVLVVFFLRVLYVCDASISVDYNTRFRVGWVW